MTANYFMITELGLGLDGALYPPFAEGTPPVTVGVDGGRRRVRRNLITNPSAEYDLSGWMYYGEVGPGNTDSLRRLSLNPKVDTNAFRLLPVAGTTTRMAMKTTVAVEAGKTYTFQFSAKGVNASVGVAAVKCDISFDDGPATVYSLGTISGSHVVYSKTFTVPAGFSLVTVAPAFEMAFGANDAIFIDAIMLEESATAGTYFDGSTPDTSTETYDWDGATDTSTSTCLTPVYDVPSLLTGTPADLSGVPYLWHGNAGDPDYPADQSMPWPSGFFHSVFRVVRDPAVVADDSGLSLDTQIYTHGWLLAERLNWYFQDTSEDDLVWPMPSFLAVIPVTGTPAVNDGKGWHGLQSVTWPGGVGTLRQIVAGDEGSTRQVGVILDRLAALGQTGRDTIAGAYNATTVKTPLDNLFVAAGHAPNMPWAATAAQRQFWGRHGLNARLAKSAVGLTSKATGDLMQAVTVGMMAVTALEVGLVGATFTSANYQTLTDPIDAAIAMPGGY